jgi:hypothetical protein
MGYGFDVAKLSRKSKGTEMTLFQSRRAILTVAVMMASSCAAILVAQTPPTVDNTVVVTKPEAKVSAPLVNSETPGTSLPTPADGSSETSKPNTVATKDSTVTPNPVTQATDEWQFQISPYLWIAGINGEAGIGNLVVDVNSGITASDVHLNFGFMGTFEARKNKFIILTDLQYSNLGTDRPTPGPLFTSATADFKTFILDPEVGYRVAQNEAKGRFLDVLGGIRYWHLRSDLNFTAGILPPVSITRSRGWVDAVVGVRGNMALSPKFFLVGKADVGGGGSKFTYQLFGGVGFRVSKSVALIGAYRALSVDYDKDDFLFDMVLSGPVLGVGFKF